MRRFLSAIFLLAMPCFVGCRGHSFYWYNPDRTLKQAKHDCRECEDQARVEAIAEAIHYKHKYRYPTSLGPVYRNVQFDQCIKQKNYSRVPRDELSSTVRKRLFKMADERHQSVAGN
ncbi:MAG: hypothetical protein GY845_02650 [Planctomycetes bacterium]|nr:hypothetical protein [Planctomycetota bacterium]